jgi:hypothetical protein
MAADRDCSGMIDLLFLTHNRIEFTKASLTALIANTNWREVKTLILYDDDSSDGTREYLNGIKCPSRIERRYGKYGSPVAVMNDYLCGLDPCDNRMFGKIDNDTMVPPRWLDEALKPMCKYPGLSLLGIEAFNPIEGGNINRGFTEARFIGGIGLMRNGCFVTLPRPKGRFGFTAWQEKTEFGKKGWIDPSLPVFLLDRIPREPWMTLSKGYEAEGLQRHWDVYPEHFKVLWEWFCE